MLSSSSSSSLRRARRSVRPSSSSSPSADSSSGSSSSLKLGPAVFSLISPSSSSAPSSRLSGAGSFDSMASRSRISRSCISPLLSAVDHSMIALKVVGLSHSPKIIVSRPASIRLAMAISPSRLSSSTAPISRRYIRTGSSVRSTVSFFFSVTSLGPSSSLDSSSASSASSRSRCSSPSSLASSFSTILTPISLSAAMMSSICSDDIWSCGRASFNSS